MRPGISVPQLSRVLEVEIEFSGITRLEDSSGEGGGTDLYALLKI